MTSRTSVFRSGNPALSDETFNVRTPTGEATMTIQGTVWKSWALIILVALAGTWSWGRQELFLPYWMAWCLGAFAIGMVTTFNKTWAPFTAPAYAVVEGFVLGVLSMLFERAYPGIVLQAVILTVGTFLALLLAYQSRLIKVTENLKLGIVAATGAVCITYLIDLGLYFFGNGRGIPVIHEASPWGIAFSLFVVAIAAFNLVMDFDFIEAGAESGAPKYMEWYAAFGLIVTLVWLYVEILRLLGKSRRSRK